MNALAYLNKIAASDPGSVFIARDGSVAFRDRDAAQIPSGVIFSDDGSGIPFQNLQIEYGTERLNNVIQIVYTGGTATATNTQSQEAYGLSSLSVDTLLSNLDQSQKLADFYAGRFSEPLVRITGLSVPVDALSGVQLGQILALDLGEQVTVQFTPNNIGDAIAQDVLIESIEHNIDPGRHLMTLSLSAAISGFILDSDKLDEDTLGF